MQETQVRKLPWRRKGHPTPLLLPGKIPWTEEPGGLQRVRHDWAMITQYTVIQQSHCNTMTLWREVAQSCPTLCDPMDCSLSGFTVHGIFQARVLEWIAIFFSRGSSQHRNRTRVSLIAGRCFTGWATREAEYGFKNSPNGQSWNNLSNKIVLDYSTKYKISIMSPYW